MGLNALVDSKKLLTSSYILGEFLVKSVYLCVSLRIPCRGKRYPFKAFRVLWYDVRGPWKQWGASMEVSRGCGICDRSCAQLLIIVRGSVNIYIAALPRLAC